MFLSEVWFRPCFADCLMTSVFLACAGIVGEADENGEDYVMWTHKKLNIGYNGDKIVDINLTSDKKVKLTPQVKIQFTYEVY